MLKSNNVVLLKAVAMSALLVNGSIGTDSDDKYSKGSDKPSCNSRPHRPEVTSEAEQSHAQYAVAEILSPLDERARIAREVLSRHRNIDFTVTSIDTALKFLSYAKQYSAKLKLNLLNITMADLDKILAENEGNIEELEWSYSATPVSLSQDSEEDYNKKYALDTWYTVEDAEDDKLEGSLKYMKTNLRGSEVKYIDDDKDDKGKYLEDDTKDAKYIDDDGKYLEDDTKDAKYIDDDGKYLEDDTKDAKYIDDDKDDKGKYLEDDTKGVKYIEDDEKDKEDLHFIEDDEDEAVGPNGFRNRFPNLNRQFHPNDVDNLPIRRRAASRGLRAPDIGELLNNAGQKGTPLVSPPRNGVDNGFVPQNEVNPPVGGWKFTTLRNDMKNQDSSDFLSPKDHSKPPKQPNLVRFYCHQDPVLVRAQ